MKKIISLGLVLLMLLSILIGCKKGDSSNSDNSDSAAPSDTSTDVETDDYGQNIIKSDIDADTIDYGGANVYILTRSLHQYQREMGVKDREDTVDQRVYERNARVEADLGVKLVVLDGQSDWDKIGFSEFITNQAMAGSPAADVVLNNMIAMTAPTVMQYFVNLNSDSMTYLDTSKECWNQEYVEAASAYGVLPTIVGDINLSVYDRIITLFVNNNLLGSTSQTKESLQQMVLDGKWTFEEFQKLVREYGWTDKDNSNTQTVGDDYGIASIWTSEAIDPMTAAFDLVLVSKNDKDEFQLTYEMNAVKINNAYDVLKEFWNDASAYANREIVDVNTPIDMFCTQKSLFLQDLIHRDGATFSKIQNVQFSYMLLPLPKYDEYQANYQTFSQDMFNVIGVMNSIDDDRKERASAALELMCEKSYSDVRPYYVEDVLKLRYSEGSANIQIMNMILDGVVFDSSWVYLSNLDIYGVEIFRACFYPSRMNGGQTPASAWEKGMLNFLTKAGELNVWFQQKAAEE